MEVLGFLVCVGLSILVTGGGRWWQDVRGKDDSIDGSKVRAVWSAVVLKSSFRSAAVEQVARLLRESSCPISLLTVQLQLALTSCRLLQMLNSFVYMHIS